MTARSEIVVLACLVGCGRDAKPLSDEEREARALAKDIAALSSPDVGERASAASGVAIVCCNSARDDWRPALAHVRSAACDAMERVLLTERDRRVLDSVLIHGGAACDVNISWQRILELLGARYPLASTPLQWFDVTEPSPEAARSVLALAARYADRETRAPLLIPVGRFGEQDFAPVVEAMSDSDPSIRDMGVQSMSFALGDGPLDLPEGLQALDRLSKEADEALASYAGVIAATYRRELVDPDAVVERYLADGELSFDEIRMLGVRRFSCTAKQARFVLEHLARGESGPDRAVAARRALAIRGRRCND